MSKSFHLFFFDRAIKFLGTRRSIICVASARILILHQFRCVLNSNSEQLITFSSCIDSELYLPIWSVPNYCFKKISEKLTNSSLFFLFVSFVYQEHSSLFHKSKNRNTRLLFDKKSLFIVLNFILSISFDFNLSQWQNIDFGLLHWAIECRKFWNFINYRFCHLL